MKHLFLPYELSVIAKEKGFNEDCLAVYNCSKDYKLCSENWNDATYTITNEKYADISENIQYSWVTAPLYQQILKWLRVNHNIKIVLDAESDCECYYLYCDKKMQSKYGYIENAVESALKLIK